LHGTEPIIPPFPEKNENIALLWAAAERGITVSDTAEIHGGFSKEQLVGIALYPIAPARFLSTIIL
jgi:aryl-alcohol dehydrogenase-like predicted oxidoreductase